MTHQIEEKRPLAVIIPRPDHNISRDNISPNALKVLYRLKNSGFQAFVVGGAVRDLLLGREPKDFDVATDARPEEVRELFRNCRLIGRRFRLAHVHFGREIIEVATFRGRSDPSDGRRGDVAHDTDGRILRDNVYGTIEEDVWRRDFSANSLYYNIADFSVWDYTGGVDDVRGGVLRMIGDPAERYREDPVRMLRAVRFAARLGFRIEPGSEAPIREAGGLLENVPPARLFEEVIKLMLYGCAEDSFELLNRYGLVEHLFPQTAACLADPGAASFRMLVTRALANTDERVAADKPVTPVFLFAVLLWEPIRRLAEAIRAEGHGAISALQRASEVVLAEQQGSVAVPRRLGTPMREILCLQPRFANRTGRRALRLLEHPRFRAAYDFMLLRIEAGEEEPELGAFWTGLQEVPEGELDAAVSPPRAEGEQPRRRRRRRPRRARPKPDSPNG